MKIIMSSILGITLSFASAQAQADLGSVMSDVYETTRGVVRGLTTGEEDINERGIFTDRERQIILGGIGKDTDSFEKQGKGKPKNLPKGLQMKAARGGELPPGWQKKFARGEVVSDSVYASRQALPNSVLKDIRTIDGTEVIQVDDKVARVIKDTRTIIDVIDIFQGRSPN